MSSPSGVRGGVPAENVLISAEAESLLIVERPEEAANLPPLGLYYILQNQ